jgi:hypothetical protein
MNYVRHNNRLMSDLRYMLAFGIKISVLPENLQRDLKPIKKQLVEEYEGLQQVLPALLSEHALKYDEKSKSFSPHGMTKLPRELKDRIMEFLVDNPHTLSNFTAAEIKEEKEKPLEDRIIRVGSMDSLIKKGDPIPIETAVTTAKYLFRDILESGLLLRSYIPDESWQRYSDNLVKSFDKAGITLTTRSQTHELVFMLFEKGDVISVNRVVEKAIKRFKEDTKHKTPELKLEKDSTEKRLDEDFPEKDKPAKRPNKRKTPYENFGSKVEEDHPDKKSK